MEKRIQELEDSVKVLARYMKTELEHMEKQKHEVQNLNIEKKVAMLSEEIAELREMLEKEAQYSLKEEELHEVKEESLEKILNDIEPIEKELEEEDMERVSIEKNLSDIRQHMSELEARTRKLSDLEHKEEVITKHIEEVSERFLAAGLAEFSRDIDRTYPMLATKTEFEKFSMQMQRKIDSIEVPDMSQIERKVNDLENKVLRLINIVEDIYNRLPAVVE